MNKYTLIKAPVCNGSPTVGAHHAFSALCRLGLASALGADLVSLERSRFAGEPAPKELRALGEVIDVSRRLMPEVEYSIRNGAFPITVGGDHSCAMGSIAGASAVYGADGLSVVYIDGHTDINTEKTTLTGYIHGMPLAAAMGLCTDRLTVGRKVNLKGENIFIVGARSIDPGEYTIIEENGVTLITAEEMKSRGIEDVMADVLSRIKTGHIHVSFDVDFMDGEIFPSTGYRMENGATLSEAEAALGAVISTGKVCSLDVVEYNPTVDVCDRDGKALCDLILKVLK